MQRKSSAADHLISDIHHDEESAFQNNYIVSYVLNCDLCVILSNPVCILNFKGLFNVARVTDRHGVKLKLMDRTDISIQMKTKSLF